MALKRNFVSLCWYLGAAVLGVSTSTPAVAQPTPGRMLAQVEFSPAGMCTTIDVMLNYPASFTGQFPEQSGVEFDVRLDPVEANEAPDITKLQKETASVVPGNPAGLSSLSYDPAGARPVVHLLFDYPVKLWVTKDINPRHILITTARTGSLSDCTNIQAEAKSGLGDKVLSPLAEGKKAMVAKDYPRAVALFTKAVAMGDDTARREAQELLGLARERAGQLAHAKAEYRNYLRAYPNGAGAERVQQRLAGVLAASEEEANLQFEERRNKKTNLLKTDTAISKTNTSKKTSLVANSKKGDLGGSQGAAQQWEWESHGSISQIYYRDDGFTNPAVLRGSMGDHNVNQDEIVSTVNFTARGENATTEVKVRVAGSADSGLDSNLDDYWTNTFDEYWSNISTAYVDVSGKQNGLSARLGRQSLSYGGVFGRFDGAMLGWQVSDQVKLQAIVGSPIYYRADQPFSGERYFYGAGVNLASKDKAWSSTIYAIEQRAQSVVDRRAIGTEVRFAKNNLSSFGGFDYDFLYNEFNYAYLSGSWNATGRLALYGTVDYRHVPYILTSNALIGQQTDSLSTLIDLFGKNETAELAVDRTASAKTATAGFSYKLSEDWQLAIDATIADYSGTPESGGVGAACGSVPISPTKSAKSLPVVISRIRAGPDPTIRKPCGTPRGPKA